MSNPTPLITGNNHCGMLKCIGMEYRAGDWGKASENDRSATCGVHQDPTARNS